MAKYLVTGPHRNEHGGMGWGVVVEFGYTIIPPILPEYTALQCALALTEREQRRDEADHDRWVSVADELPPEMAEVLVAYELGGPDVMSAWWDGERFLDISATCWPDPFDWASDRVLFWRHYPRPPESMMQDAEGDDA